MSKDKSTLKDLLEEARKLALLDLKKRRVQLYYQGLTLGVVDRVIRSEYTGVLPRNVIEMALTTPLK